MLVILTDEQMLSPQQVCCNCLLANSKGLPRWHQGKLGCGLALSARRSLESPAVARGDREEGPPEWYECPMGFRVAAID